MRIVAKRNLREFAIKYPAASNALFEWHDKTKAAQWTTATDVRNTFNSADNIGGERWVFNIGGNKYRLVAAIDFEAEVVYIKFIGTHAEYDTIDVYTVRKY